MTAPFALYVHFPWCRHVCPYCDFNVYALARPPEAAFVSTLTAELTRHCRDAAWSDRRIKTVYLGGGTPSMFSPESVAVLIASIDAHCGIVDGAEITLEANPGTLTAERLRAFRLAGVNRLSLGAQSFDATVLRTLGRDHTADETRTTVAAARAAGFDNISLDLIFAVPGQSVHTWVADVDTFLALRVDHLSAYALTYEPGTPFHGWRTTGRVQAVPEDDELAMLDHLTQQTDAAGFERYEISSWARAGATARHNQSYWDGSDYLGLGPGAHSFNALPTPGIRSVNHRLPDAYRSAVERGETSVSTAEVLSLAQARAEFVITGLRRVVGVDDTAFRQRFGTTIAQTFPQIGTLLTDGLLQWSGSRLRLSPRGLLFADTVGAALV